MQSITKAYEAVLTGIRHDPGTVFLLGDVDSGKTTFARALLKALTESGYTVGFIDSDIGQSTIGPPGTIGASIFGKGQYNENLNSYGVGKKLHFIGRFSPVRHVPEILIGINRLMNHLKSMNTDLLLIDTTGLVHGRIGFHLKKLKIELLRPEHIVLFQRGRELEHMRCLWDARMHDVPISPNTRVRSADERSSYREERLRDYFRQSTRTKLPLPTVIHWTNHIATAGSLPHTELSRLSRLIECEVLYASIADQLLFIIIKDRKRVDIAPLEATFDARYIVVKCIDDLLPCLASIESGRMEILSLAVLHHIDFSADTMLVTTHPVDASSVKALKLGAACIDLVI
ncbi:MAG: Clp1/GlmU family protein [candidate division KSB1 bacterium]|jgi:polynucleotide 5'-hydroxyl-kinase GRC3/NOL9|nr:Clp1/GlmU family protein [candidate division KSB1 bacterium]